MEEECEGEGTSLREPLTLLALPLEEGAVSWFIAHGVQNTAWFP